MNGGRKSRHPRRQPMRMLPSTAAACLALAASGASRGAVPPVAVPPALGKHAAVLAQTLPPGFTMIIEPPFVVLGDEAPDIVRRRAVDTVRWTVTALRRDFFARDPEEIIDIWLFRDGASYTNHARSIFGDSPGTPFGYYSARHNALIMNIATGGGTLVHEIVHPFMRANFPACPAWFNEGLASLYEQSTSRDGHIRGLTNWRLKGLQEAIQRKEIISFEKVTAMTDDAFYGRTTGSAYNSHYAQARYLCYYLQEQGLLVRFYREFAANAKEDPTGYQTLRKVLGNPDMTAFQGKWEDFVLSLKFP